MRLLTKSVVTMGLAALMAAPAMAQQRRGGGGFGFGGQVGLSMLLSNPSVQQELKLDDSQKEKAREFSEKTREKLTAAREEIQNVGPDQRARKFREMMTESNTAARKAAGEILKPEQVQRLQQIELQVAGASAFEEEHLQKKLNLTAEQTSAITELIQSSAEQSREIFQKAGDDRQGAMEKLRELRKETLAKVEGKLTGEQKSKYKGLLGSPFELRRQGPGGGRRGGD